MQASEASEEKKQELPTTWDSCRIGEHAPSWNVLDLFKTAHRSDYRLIDSKDATAFLESAESMPMQHCEQDHFRQALARLIKRICLECFSSGRALSPPYAAMSGIREVERDRKGVITCDVTFEVGFGSTWNLHQNPTGSTVYQMLLLGHRPID